MSSQPGLQHCRSRHSTDSSYNSTWTWSSPDLWHSTPICKPAKILCGGAQKFLGSRDKFAMHIISTILGWQTNLGGICLPYYAYHKIQCVSKKHQLWNSIAQHYKDRFWWQFALFSLSGLKDETLIKKQNNTKNEARRLYSRVFWIFLPNVIKINVSKLVRFFLRHTVIAMCLM